MPTAPLGGDASPPDNPIPGQERFDDLVGERERRPPGAEVVAPLASGRLVHYIDVGDRAWRPIVFFGGFGTSVGAFLLTEFARTTREQLGLRVISVERNGFGDTSFNPSLHLGDAVDDVLAVLAAVDVERFALVAFSGGGPYAAALAERVPDRLISLHLAAAAAGWPLLDSDQMSARWGDSAEIARDPRGMWQFPADSPVHRIPGFTDAAAAEGVRALANAHPPEHVRPAASPQTPGVRALAASGRGAQALAHEWRLLCTEPLPDLGSVVAPAYLYWGELDQVVSPAHAEAWRCSLANVVALRRYDGEAHDVQYRHWDQILVDAAGLGERTLVCAEGHTRLVPNAAAAARLADGATLGLCAWSSPPLAPTRSHQGRPTSSMTPTTRSAAERGIA